MIKIEKNQTSKISIYNYIPYVRVCVCVYIYIYSSNAKKQNKKKLMFIYSSHYFSRH